MRPTITNLVNNMDRYEKALELARAYYDKDANAFLDTIFPELKESRDEQIRKAIIKSLDMPFPEDNLPGSDVTYEEAVSWCEKQKEQKPAEVDESTKRLNDNWMKQHFDDYEEQKPAEWSEEDKEMLDYIINVLDKLGFEEFCKSSRDQDVEEDRLYYKEIQVLKKLKSLRPSWKPSKEQLEALQNAVALAAGNKVLAELYEQLKQL